jgi:hypothetical protein
MQWAYLLLDHLNFWKQYLKEFAESIRQVVVSLGCYFPPAGSDLGFAEAAFIDNTMNATCRPAGGPARDGKNAPRNDRFIQQAWYNGWKIAWVKMADGGFSQWNEWPRLWPNQYPSQ